MFWALSLGRSVARQLLQKSNNKQQRSDNTRTGYWPADIRATLALKTRLGRLLQTYWQSARVGGAGDQRMREKLTIDCVSEGGRTLFRRAALPPPIEGTVVKHDALVLAIALDELMSGDQVSRIQGAEQSTCPSVL